MKKSELKEMIKSAMMAEGDNYYEDGMDEAKKVEVEDDENIDVDIEKNVKVDDESTESDIEVDTMMPGESETEQAVQGLLLKAQEEAAKLSDEKLTDQIGNTITYFTRAHISQVDEAEDYNSDVADISMDNPAEDAEVGFALEESLRFKKLAGIITEGEYKSRLAEAKEIDMAKSFLENKGLKVEAVKSGNEGNDKAGKEGEAFIWDGGEGDMNYKSDGKEAFYVYMPFDEEIMKEMKSKFPVIKTGGKSGKYYEVVIEKK